MNTLKTAIVVLLLLVVLYGVYTTLNSPTKGPPPEVAQQGSNFEPPDVDVPDMSSAVPVPFSPSAASPLGSASTVAAPPLEATPSPLASPLDARSAPPLAVAKLSPSTDDANNTPPTVEGKSATPLAASSPYPSTGEKPIEETLNMGARAFDRAWKEAQKLLEKRQLAEAHKALSVWYQSPDLKPEQAQQLVALLDQLAGTVIYSSEHLLEPSYAVKRGETLEQIAEQYAVPVQLLANINSLKAPYPIVQGQQLKVVRGPFRAEVSLAPPHQLTVFLGQYYAGRFDVSFGASPMPKEGNYSVLQKMVDRAYFPAEGGSVPSGASGNPYGAYWLGLEDQMCLHATSPAGDTASRGCVGLSARDASDVYSILSVGSRVTIRR